MAAVSDIAKVGRVVANKYRIDGVLGEGGMGVVVVATDTTLERKLAMKFMRPELAKDPEAAARFLREARASVKLSSDHVARVHEVGTAEDGAPFMAMEFLDGKDLAAHLVARGRFEIDEAIGYVVEACDAVAEAHAVGIVHRDLKPMNLFLARRPKGRHIVKVLDFGISKLVAEEGTAMQITHSIATLGSPLYMAPEQMRSARNCDARTDVWALGVILFEFLIGRVPFMSHSATALALMVAQDPPPRPRDLRPEIPREVEDAILKCLAKAPAARFASVDEFVAAIEPFGKRGVETTGPLATATAAPDVGRAAMTPVTAPVPRAFETTDDDASTAVKPPPVGARPAVNTAANWGRTQGGSRTRDRAIRVALALVGTVVTLAVVGLLIAKSSSPADPSATTAAIVASAPAVAAPPTPPPTEGAPPAGSSAPEACATPPPSARPSAEAGHKETPKKPVTSPSKARATATAKPRATPLDKRNW